MPTIRYVEAKLREILKREPTDAEIAADLGWMMAPKPLEFIAQQFGRIREHSRQIQDQALKKQLAKNKKREPPRTEVHRH